VKRTRALLVLLLAAGCGGERRAAEEPAAGTEDGLRIAVLAPAAAEILDALGETERVVAVGDFVQWPPSLAGRPRIGAYDNPNLERLLALRADLLLTAESQAGGAAFARLRALGVRVVELDTATYQGVLAAVDQVGLLVGRRQEARAEAARIRSGVEAVRARAARLPKRRVLFAVGRDPLYIAGPGSHFDELIAAAGGENVFSDARSPYLQVSVEAALERRPEVILDSSDNRPGALRGRAAGSWGQWPFLPAVRAGRVYWVDPTRVSIPGPRLPEMALLFGRLIHPEVFGEAAPADFRALSEAGAAGAAARPAAGLAR
jgi:iron complex transport system substrate-binding protein